MILSSVILDLFDPLLKATDSKIETNPTASNYNSNATIDNGNCFYTTHTIEEIVTDDPSALGEGTYSATIMGVVRGFEDHRSSSGPQVIIIRDENNFEIDAVNLKIGKKLQTCRIYI